jgi:predicted nucleic acid-binding protein
MKRLRLYLDNCCFNRPYDDQSHETVRLESEAKIFIQDRIRGKELDLIWSFILDFENVANPYEDQKEAIADWKRESVENIVADESIRKSAGKIEKACGIKPKDALHLACAIHAKCDYFITTDRIFLKKTFSFKEITVLNPMDFVIIMENK